MSLEYYISLISGIQPTTAAMTTRPVFNQSTTSHSKPVTIHEARTLALPLAAAPRSISPSNESGITQVRQDLELSDESDDEAPVPKASSDLPPRLPPAIGLSRLVPSASVPEPPAPSAPQPPQARLPHIPPPATNKTQRPKHSRLSESGSSDSDSDVDESRKPQSTSTAPLSVTLPPPPPPPASRSALTNGNSSVTKAEPRGASRPAAPAEALAKPASPPSDRRQERIPPQAPAKPAAEEKPAALAGGAGSGAAPKPLGERAAPSRVSPTGQQQQYVLRLHSLTSALPLECSCTSSLRTHADTVHVECRM